MILFVYFAQAQVDSTKINKSNDLENELEDLDKSLKEFDVLIKEFSQKIGKLEVEKNKESTTEQRKNEIETEIKDLEKQIAALEKGLAEIEMDKKKREENGKVDDNEDDEDDDEDDEDDDDDDNEFNFDWDEFDFDFFPFKKKKKFNGSWAGFEMGLTNFLNSENKNELPLNGEFMELDPVRSWSFALNFMEFNIPIHKNYFGITTGVGFEWKTYYLAKNGFLYYDENENIAFQEVDYTISRNKFNINSFTFPLLAEIQFPVGKKDKRIKITGGVIGSIRVGSNTSQTWEEGKTDNYFKQQADYNLNTFKYAYTLRAGYRGFQVYATYEPTALFETGKGPELYPISVGIRLLDF